MNEQKHDKHRTNSLADSIAGLNDPSMGDERERDVILRAYTFASVISMYVLLVLAIIFAVIGAGLWTVLIIAAGGVVGMVVSVYCKREGVDFSLALARVRPQRMVISQVIQIAFVVVWLVAIVYHQSAGHPLVDAGLGFMPKDGPAWPMVLGAIVGGCGAAAIVALNRRKALARALKEAESAADIEDED